MSTDRPFRVPKYCKHPNGQAFVQVQRRRIYLGKYGTPESMERYQRIKAELEAQPSALWGFVIGGKSVERHPGPPEGLLVVQLCAAYREHAKWYYRKAGRPSGHLHRIKAALAVLRRLYGDTPAAKFGPMRLQTVAQQLVREGRARGYVNSLIGVIKRAFKWAGKCELLPGSVYQDLVTVDGLKRGRTEAREPEPIGPVADAAVDATLPHLPAVVADMVRLQRLTGCRPGEVCQLRPCDVDRSGDVWLYRVPGHKTEHTGRARVVAIGPRAQEVLAPYLLRPADAFWFSPLESERQRRSEQREARKTAVQPSQVDRSKAKPRTRPGARYTRDSYRRAVTRAVELANREAAQPAGDRRGPALVIPHWHPNQLRHTKATEVRRLFGLEAAQVTLGHAHAKITEVYAKRDTRLPADIARRIG